MLYFFLLLAAHLSTLESTSTVVDTTPRLVLVQFTRVLHVALVDGTVGENEEDSGSAYVS